MSFLNLLVHLNAYRDTSTTNNPNLNHFKWTQDLQGLTIAEPESKCITLQPNQSLTLFSGTVSTSAGVTTTWDIFLKPGSSNIYRIEHNGGTAPSFRTARTPGSDATTAVTVTKNAKLLTFTSTAGTAFDFVTGGVQIGDEVRIGSVFSASNQGKFKALAFTATSITVENEVGAAEGPIVLGATFADEVNVFSQNGVQVGDKVDIIANFSSSTFGTYDIVDVSPTYIDFFSSSSLASETAVSNSPSAFLIYRDAKQFLYIESDKKLDIKLNGSTVTNQILPLSAGVAKKPGFFMSSASIKSAEIVNKSQSPATIFYVTAE